MTSNAVTVTAVQDADRQWVRSLVLSRWGADFVVSRGKSHRPHQLRGLVAWLDGAREALLTYAIADGQMEIVTLDSLVEDRGLGTALLDAAARLAREEGVGRLWLVTTNDNIRALGFYQRRGYRLVAVHRDALDVTRRLKPSLPVVGASNIPLHDEIELELSLGS